MPSGPDKLSRAREWLRSARGGQKITYHLGDLAADRLHRKDVDEVATLFYNASEIFGEVCLVQSRAYPGAVEYIAVKRRDRAR